MKINQFRHFSLQAHFALVAVLAFALTAAAQQTKVEVCHVDGNGNYNKIIIGQNGFDAHVAHGDAAPNNPVPGVFGKKFDTNCVIVNASPNFVVFNIRNNNSIPLPQRISAPWDEDMSIIENVVGDGFAASTPRGGQKVGYGTNFFDGQRLNSIDSVNWDKLSGKVGIFSYLNIWVTDGTNYAIIASENDYRGQDFATHQEWKVFEYNTAVPLDWLFPSGAGARDGSQYLTRDGNRVTFADFGDNIVIASPGTIYPSYVGSGAPRGGYGFNLIFGDTQDNFVGSYSLENLSVTASGVTYHAAN